jgi:hypothetical protein
MQEGKPLDFYSRKINSAQTHYTTGEQYFKLLPLPQPNSRTRAYAQIYPSTQRPTQLRGVSARAYSVSIQNLSTVSNTTVP